MSGGLGCLLGIGMDAVHPDRLLEEDRKLILIRVLGEARTQLIREI